MRLGLVITEKREAEMARLAEEHGLFGVLAGTGDPLTAINAAIYASTATRFVRVVVRVKLGLEHPVTIAEELAILDNVNNGRTVVVADSGDLDEEWAADEIAVLREALASRPIQHDGPRWKVPAGLPANVSAPRSIALNPKPAQLEIPFWLTGPHSAAIADASGLPVLARDTSSAGVAGTVQPGLTAIEGELTPDRELVAKWAESGATHLLLQLPEGAELGNIMTMVSRYLSPEVLMPNFPRVMSDSRVPLPWPGGK